MKPLDVLDELELDVLDELELDELDVLDESSPPPSPPIPWFAVDVAHPGADTSNGGTQITNVAIDWNR